MINSFRFRIFFAFVLISLVFAIPVFAQNVFTIDGTVKDRNGAVVGRAEARLLNAAKKIVAETKTNELGEFRFEVPSGVYSLIVRKDGMNEAARDLNIGESQTLEIFLEPKTPEASVTVTSNSEFAEIESQTVTKTATPLRDLPQSVEVIGQKLLESQNARSMQDALYNVTAVTVAQGEGRRDQFFIRGFTALGDQFIDGVRDDAPYYRDLANVERLEVVKGPAAVLFGRGSSGGLINRVTKQPSFSNKVGGAEFSFGSYGLKRGSVDYGQPIFGDKLAFRLVGAYEKSGSFRHFYFLDRYNIAPSLAWRPLENTDVTVQFEYLNDQRLPDRGIPSFRGQALVVPIATYYGAPEFDELRHRVTSQAVRFEHRFSDFWLVRNVFRHTGYASDFYNTVPSGVCLFNSATGTCSSNVPASVDISDSRLRVSRTHYTSSSKQNNYFNQTETVGIVRAFSWQHTFLAGVELGTQDKNTIRFDYETAPQFLRNSYVTLFNPILTPLVTRAAPSNYNDFAGRVFGVYFQDQINFSRQWKALVGARYDRFVQKLDDLRPNSIDLKRTDKQWSPRAGLVYQPQDWLSLYASWTRSFQPSGENLSLAANNAELEPETTQNYETGIKAAIPKTRLNATLAVFRLDRNNIKTTDPQNPTRLLLVGQQRTDGIEATLFGSPIEKLEIYAGYALLSARILRSNNVSAGVPLEGRRAGLAPQSSGNFWATYQLPRNFRIGFGAFARTKVFTSANNLVTLPGFVRFDASLTWRAEKHYEIGFNLKNITNRRYYETSNGDNNILAGSPINGSVTLRYRW
ncbi:MAG: TonB-dependent siderophore receptor [Acidobacteriota bacterium]|nr:TonB-dependent siderophore receptor [Acidobacteriota bacterium]